MTSRTTWTRFSPWAGALAICASLPCATAFGQANPGLPPPAHLPRFIWECEVGSGASAEACGVWSWQGASYSATWSIGAMGQLNVTSGEHSEISVHRQDTSGSLAGLDATYTAKWDGSRFSDGKMTFTFRGAPNTGVWRAAPLVTPVVHTLLGTVQTITQDEIYGVGRRPAPYYNWYSADLTGYAIYSSHFEGAANLTVVEDFRVRGEQPMKPGERRVLSLHAKTLAPNYEGGAKYPAGSAIAAIYADGTTFGDPKVLAAMIGFRRSMLAALTGIGNTLCQLGGPQATVDEVQAALGKQQSAEDSRSPSDKEARAVANDYVNRSLHARGQRSASEAIKRTRDRLEELRSGLADPVKSNGGQPAIPAAAPLSCHLS